MRSDRLLTLTAALAFLPALLSAQTGNPIAVFSTYLGGSGNENLRDVTSDDEGNVYVTGGTSSPDYPTTPGAYDRTFATGGSSLGSGGPMDVFVAKYSPSGELLWSTFLGGPNYDRAYAIEVDREGYVYVGGRAGDDFPTTAGVLQEDFAGDVSPNGLYGKQDAFVAKLSPAGDSLIWATYFGADDLGFARDIDIDGEGNVYLAFSGATRPNPHITAGAYQTTPGGAEDMIVAKISADGARVLWATYYGGSGYDGGGPAIRVHTDGTVTVVGSTGSDDLPRAGAGATFEYGGSTRDLYVARFSADGSQLVWGRFFGGRGNESTETHNLALDDDGNAYIAAYTTSHDLPVTTATSLLGNADIPVAKFSGTDGELLAARYLGGNAGENAQGIAITSAGKVVVGGATTSFDYPVSFDALQLMSAGGSDMIVTVLEPDLSSILWSTRVGGKGEDDGRTLWADREGNVYLAGHTDSRDFPLYDPAQSIYGGGRDDGVIVHLRPPVTRDSRVRIDLLPECVAVIEEGRTLGFWISLSHPTDTAITLQVSMSGTASRGSDYLGGDTIVTIPPGRGSVSVNTRVLADTLVEGIEYIRATVTLLSGPAYIPGDNTVSMMIVDDDSPAANLLVDPGFEMADTAWKKTSNGGRSISSELSRTGTRSVRMDASNQYPREVYQDVPISAGLEYILSGYLRIEGVEPSAILEIVWLGYSGNEVGRVWTPQLIETDPPGWDHISACAEAPSNAWSARVTLWMDVEDDGEGTVWFDDIGLYRVDGQSWVEEGIGVPVRIDLR